MQKSEYRTFVTNFLEFLLAQDIGTGDQTTALLTNPKKIITAEIRAKEKGVLAGIEEATFFLKKKGIQIIQQKKDGSRVKKNEVVLVLQSSAQKILTLERITLNLIQRMSGIATAASKLAKKVGKQKFSATRKTPFGLLDTKAVVVGGGLPHRLNLADMILVKENHLAIDPECWKSITTKNLFEIEADSVKLAIEIATHFATTKNLILLLDNFTPAQLKKLVPKLRTINPNIILEASGNITEKNAKVYLNAGVDYVSLGSLTHSVNVLDFSLVVLWK